MKLCFYANHPYYGGLANNGGSRTIIKSAETLEKLGHTVDIIAKVDRFTYFPHKKPLKSITKKYDHYIAVSILDLHDMLKHVDSRKSSVWIRGHETWRMKYPKLLRIVNKYRVNGSKVFVNSYGLKSAYSGLILYPGYDDIWKQKHQWVDRKKLTIGVLCHKRKTKEYGFFKEVRNKLEGRCEYVKAGITNLNDKGMAEIYHKCDIWFAPTSLEGLHCPPMEAALCGALVVCSDHPNNGMVGDYATPETAMIYNYGDVGDAVRAIRYADFGKVPKMIEKIKSGIGTRERNMKRLIKLIGG